MIRLRRAPEPEELRRQRAFRLAEALLWPSPTGHRPNTDDGYGHDSVRNALAWDTQHGLCAYCGACIEAKRFPVEHFRPRATYWWLTWTWENLWISCNTCQAKGDEFELDGSSPRLAPPMIEDPDLAFETERERPLLLDPGVDDPKLHLRVVPYPDGKWWWEPIPGSPRGKHTWERLHLQRSHRDRLHAYERLQRHLKTRVRPDCDAVNATIAAGDSGAAHDKWQKLCAVHLYRRADFLVPTWWFLDQFHRDSGLSSHGMAMPPYPDGCEGDGTPPPQSSRPWPNDIPAELVEPRTRLLVHHARNNKNASNDRLREAIVALCRQGPKTDAELCEVLGRGPSTMRTHTNELCRRGQLERVGGQDPPLYRAGPTPFTSTP